LLSAVAQTVTVTPTSLSFGNLVQGTSSSVKKVALKNGQSTAITISSITSNLSDYTQTNNCPISPATLSAGSSCTISVTFTPATLGSLTGMLSVNDNAGSSPQNVALSGTGIAAVTATPSSISFGNQPIGRKSSASTVTVQNNQTKSLTITSITTNLADYTTSTTCPLRSSKTLAAGSSCTISVFFTPAVAGTRSGTLTIADNASVSPTVSLTGTGIVPAAVNTSSLTFTSQALGTTSAAQMVTLTDNQSSSLKITSITSSASDFPFTSNCPLSPSTLAAGASCAAFVTFSPKATGSRTGTLSFNDNASNSPQAVFLTGTGTAATLVSIAVSPQAASVALGKTQQFTAAGTYTDGSTQNLTNSVTWNSSAPAVASVSSTGLATGAGTGSATITATLGSISGSSTLSVTPPALVSIAIAPMNPSFALGTTQQLHATGTYTDGSTLDLTTTVIWNTANHGVATVDSQGLATSVTVGSTSVTATSGSITGSTALNVTPAALVSLAVTPAIPSIPLGSTQQFTATGTFTDGSTQDVTKTVHWSSDTTTVATINNVVNTQGLATSVGTGSAVITASSGSISGSTSLTVTAAVLVSIAVTPTNPSVALGTTQQFTATGTFTDGSTQDLTSRVTWASETASTATVNKTGLVTSTGTGTTTISASSGTVTGSTVLTVTVAALVSIAINPQSATIPLGATQQFTATGTYTDGTTQDLTQSGHWSSTAGNVATISNSAGTAGLASTLGTGLTTIGISSGSVSASASLTVNPAALVSISISPQAPTIPLGTTQQFSATGSYTDGSTQDVTSVVTWSSSSATVVIISNASGTNGLATSAGVGTANITATSGPVSTSTTMIVGQAALSSIAAMPASTSIALGVTQQFTAMATYSDGSTQDITQSANWASSVPDVATVNSTGLATSRSAGSTTVSASSGSVTGSTSLTVNSPAPVSVVIAPLNPTVYVGSLQQFTATLTYSDGSSMDVTSTVTWISSTPGVATINASGQASSLAAGLTTIEAMWGSNLLTATTTLTARQCGPPSYGCSRSDFAVSQVPNPVPNMGGTIGLNTIVTPSDFNVPILRATDSTTSGGLSFSVTPSGAGADNIWNTTSTMLIVTFSTQGQFGVLGFNPAIMQSTGLVPGFKVGGMVTFSRANPNVLYQFSGTRITRWTFSNTASPPTSSLVYDFTNCSGLPNPLNITWRGDMFVNAGDAVIGTAFSTTGYQGTGVWAVAYNFALNACSAYNTQTAQVVGNWGTTGPASDNASYAIHEAYMSLGSFFDISISTCTSGDCVGVSGQHYFWQPGTTTVNHCSTNCGGHSVPGYNTWLNFTSFPQVGERQFTAPNTVSFWPGTLPSPCCTQLREAHMSWNNDNPNDTAPFFVTTSTTPNAPATFNTPLINEIIGYMPDGTLRRFAHSFSTGSDPNFYSQNAIGTVSQDGQWLAWVSDWLNTLGTDSKGNQRIDVFIVKLQ